MKGLAAVMGLWNRPGVAKMISKMPTDEGEVLIGKEHQYHPQFTRFKGQKRHGHRHRSYGPGVTGTLVRVCAGGRHAWFSTHCGLIRKPYGEREKQDGTN